MLLEPEGGGRTIYINLAKLQAGTLQALQDEADTLDPATYRGTARSAADASCRSQQRRRRRRERQDKQKLPKRIQSVKQFFGPVVQTLPDEEGDGGGGGGGEDDDQLPLTQFRLRGRQPTVACGDATTAMVLSRMPAGQVVR